MEIITGDIQCSLPPCVATIGCFDGVHRGHRYLVRQVCREGAACGMRTALITFPVHPRQVMRSDYQPRLLSCLPQKEALIRSLEMDYCIMLPFTHELSLLSAREFMQLLRDRFNVRILVIGYDHRFGHNRCEGLSDYCRYGTELGMKVIRADALVENGVSVSSSVIRILLEEGKIKDANHFLGYRYYLDGVVVNGFRMGRKMGFPTANLKPSCPDKLIPAEGVYAVYVYIGGIRYAGMLNIGCRPTFDNGSERSIEVNIFDFSGDIYNEKMRIEFVHYVRKEIKFGSIVDLTAQIEKDKETIIQLLQYKSYGKEEH